LGLNLGGHVLRPDHAAAVVADHREHGRPWDGAVERLAAEAQRARHRVVVDAQVRDGDDHVEADLQDELRLLAELRGDDDVRLPRIEVDVDLRSLEEGEGDLLLRRERLGHWLATRLSAMRAPDQRSTAVSER
jgi:hypothetical protein